MGDGRWTCSSRLLDHLTKPVSTPGMQGNDNIYLMLALQAGAVVSALLSRQFKVSFATYR
jgi:hypothetical protein